MSRKTLNLVPGSDEWLERRKSTFNASECAAMLGISPYMTRAELLRQKATGIAPEVDAFTQKRFDDGHKYEAQARPWAEETIGAELYPVSMSYECQGLPLAASMDGLTMLGDKAWECKTLNEDIRKAADRNEIPEYIRVQIEHQLIVSGADRCLFMASNGDRETAIELWYEGQPMMQQKILDGWKQFQKDLESYEPEIVEPEPVGVRPESLPSLDIRVEGKVLATNLDQYKAHALAVFDGISTDLQTDQDFKDAEEAVKFCKDVEDRLKSAKSAALAQTSDIDALFKAIDDISESARRKRLDLDKLVKNRKEARKGEIQEQAVKAMWDHCVQINTSLSHGIEISPPPSFRQDVGAAMKGKRTIQSLMDAADQALTDAKLAANAEADRIRANLQAFPELAGDHEHLFADLRTLVGKAPDDFAAAIKLRISEFEQEQARREEKRKADAEREEQRRAEQEQARRLAEQKRSVEAVKKVAALKRYVVHVTLELEAFDKDEARAIIASNLPGRTVAIDVKDQAA
jgi:putative phage-type endonuclease